MTEIGFDHVLSVLQTWLGERVKVGVEATVQPLVIAHMSGTLGAADDIGDPYDHYEYEFRVGADSGFAIRRDYFEHGTLFAESGRLIVSLREHGERPAEDAVITFDIVGPRIA